ncbi:MAG: type II toxin-antitoxin system RelE/ParE family toxin [Thiohalomonadales bacterium]
MVTNNSEMGKKQKNSTKNGTLNPEEERREIRKVIFYRLASGREPVRAWLRRLDMSCRKAIGEDLFTLQLGWPVGMPLTRKIEAGLWELRSTIPGGIARIMFTEDKGLLILLHGLIKKSQKLPVSDLALARRRLVSIRAGRK